jgi:spermidine synthase
MEFAKRTGERVSCEVERLVHARQTKFQKLEIADTVPYGRALFLDQKIQSAELDEFIYHEALAHPALVLHPSPRSVLIIGGGEGATLREALRHRGVDQVVMVDIDDEAVAACREFLPGWHQGAFDDRRVKLLHTDARAYLREHGDHFDTIIVDVTDPLAGGPSYRLFTREFYELAAARLTEHGTLAVQAESTDLGLLQAHLAIMATLQVVFPYAASYHAHVPSFGESWGFGVVSKTRDPRLLQADEVDATLAERGCADLRFYDGQTHTHLFALPRHLRCPPSQQRNVVTDQEPMYVS